MAERQPHCFAVLSHSDANVACGVQSRVFIQTVAPHRSHSPLPAAIGLSSQDEAEHVVEVVKDFCEQYRNVDGETLHTLMVAHGIMSKLERFFRGVSCFWTVLQGRTVALHLREEEVRYSLGQSASDFRRACLYDNISDALLCLFTRGRAPSGKDLPWVSYVNPNRGKHTPELLTGEGDQIRQTYNPILFPYPAVDDIAQSSATPSNAKRGQKRPADLDIAPHRSPADFQPVTTSSSVTALDTDELLSFVMSARDTTPCLIVDFCGFYHKDHALELEGCFVSSENVGEFLEAVNKIEWADVVTVEQFEWMWNMYKTISE